MRGPCPNALTPELGRTNNPRQNIRVCRKIRTGDQKLEFRVEAFNVTNSLRKGNPGAASTAPFISTTVPPNSNTFGQITTSGDARVMQFALKYVF